jgi:helicase
MTALFYDLSPGKKARISCVPDIGCSQQFANHISMLSRRVRWGAPAEALDVIRVAERSNVPGFGRQRAMALLGQGMVTFEDILNCTKEKLLQILRNEHRTNALLSAIANSIGLGTNRLAKTHTRIAKELGLEENVNECNEKLGTEYEQAIAKFLEAESSWGITVLDDGKRQNVPDILLSLDNISLLIECKTCTKQPSLIKKEEAFAVLQKAADYDKTMRRITLGKPAFDETSKIKAQASSEITLTEHTVFMEGLLRVHTGAVQPIDFVKWLAAPGVTEVDRLAGKPTYTSD